MAWLPIAVVIYALIMLGGGIGGYVAAKSVPSLVTGIISGMVLLGAAALARTEPKAGFGVATGATAMLVAIFISRYLETEGSGAMRNLGLAILSGVVLILLIIGHFTNRGSN